ncbi:hypothetical protein BBP40_001561 [Aspergillus hancockii]|nr:hypothetical protein BBP40_001561 [Aspergillus hancockii]
MQHPGPALVYMSKAPTTDKEYQGDGEWFKIHQESVCDKNKPNFTTLKVVSGGNGTPGPTVKFPGAYKKDDPSFNFSIWHGYKE